MTNPEVDGYGERWRPAGLWPQSSANLFLKAYATPASDLVLAGDEPAGQAVPATPSTRQVLASIGIDNAYALAAGNDGGLLIRYSNAPASRRAEVVAALHRESLAPGPDNGAHARVAYEHALVLEGAIALVQAQRELATATAASNQALMAQAQAQLDAAITSLVRLEGRGGARELESGNPAHAMRAVAQIHRVISGRGSGNAAITPEQILYRVTPELVRQLRQREENSVTDSLRALSVPLQSLVSRVDGRLANAVDRQTHLAAVIASVRDNPRARHLVDWLQVAHLTLILHDETTTPQAATVALRRLHALATSEHEPNVRAEQLLRHLQLLGNQGQGAANLDTLLRRLAGGQGAEVLRLLRSGLSVDHIADRFDDFAVRCILIRLPQPDANRPADRTTLTRAVQELNQQAAGGNRYAFYALCPLLLAPEQALDWRSRAVSRGTHPGMAVSADSLAEHARRNPEDLAHFRLSIAGTLSRLPDTALAADQYAVMARAAADSEALRPSLLPRLEAALNQSTSLRLVMAGLVDAVATRGADRTNMLSRLYLTGLEAGYSEPETGCFARWALGNAPGRTVIDEQALRILVGISTICGVSGNPDRNAIAHSEQARGYLLALARNPDTRAAVIAAVQSVAEPRVAALTPVYDRSNPQFFHRLLNLHNFMASLYFNPEVTRQDFHREMARHREAAREAGRTHLLTVGDSCLNLPGRLIAWWRRLPAEVDLQMRTGGNGSAASFFLRLGRQGPCGWFETAALSVPGLCLSGPWHQCLQGIESIGLDGNTLTVRGLSRIDLPLGQFEPAWRSLPLQLELGSGNGQLTADLHVHPTEDSLELRSIRGLALRFQDMVIPLETNCTMSLDRSHPESPRLRISAQIPDNLQWLPVCATSFFGNAMSKVLSCTETAGSRRQLNMKA